MIVSEPHFYGWTPSKPDFRDLMYAAPTEVLTALPAKVDLATPKVKAPFEPTWNQSRLGSCGPHTIAADVVFAALMQQKLKASPMPSRLFIYYVTRLVMGTVNSDSGVSNRDLLKAVARYGWCDEALWPYDIARFRERPPQVAFEQAVTRKISQYLAVQQTLEQMKACVASGDPFIFGFSVYESFEHPQTQKTGKVPMPKRSERQLGGHDVLILGYDDAEREFKFRNSYGDWGDDGYGYIPYEYATNPQLSSDFWTVKHPALPDDPSPPTPPDPPTPGPGRRVIITVTGGKVEVDGKEV